MIDVMNTYLQLIHVLLNNDIFKGPFNKGFNKLKSNQMYAVVVIPKHTSNFFIDECRSNFLVNLIYLIMKPQINGSKSNDKICIDFTQCSWSISLSTCVRHTRFIQGLHAYASEFVSSILFSRFVSICISKMELSDFDLHI